MNKKILLVLISVLCYVTFIFGKNEAINITHEDTGKVNSTLAKVKKYFDTEKYDSAIKFANIAISYSDKLNNKSHKARALYLLGIAKKEQGLYEEAFDDLNASLKINEAMSNVKGIAEDYSGIGMLLLRMRNYEKAEYYLKKSLELKEKFGDKKAIANLHTGIATAYIPQKKYQEAIGELNTSLELLETESDEYSKGAIYGNLGRIYKEKLNYKAALMFYKKALEIGEKYKSKGIMIRIYSSLGETYLLLCEEYFNKGELYLAQKEFNEAKGYIEQQYRLSIEMNNHISRCNAYYNFYKLYEMQNNYREALKYHKLFAELNDSLTFIENNKSINELSLKKETEIKGNEIKLLNKEKELGLAELKVKEKEKKIILLVSVSVIIVTGLLSFIFIKQYRNRQKIKLEAIEKEKIQSELNMLKNQISPHVMFNSLNTIYFQIDDDAENAKEMVLLFADLLRYQLYDCNVNFIEIEKELNYINKFVEMQKLRKSERCKIQINIQDNIKNFVIAPLLLIPLIENAFKYVTNDKDKENYVSIDFRRDDEKIIFKVKNSTYEESENTDKKYGGIGLRNLKSRLDLIYTNKHKLNTLNTGNEYTAELFIYL